MLNVAHVKNDRHQIWHTDREYKSGMYDCHIFRLLLTILWELLILV